MKRSHFLAAAMLAGALELQGCADTGTRFVMPACQSVHKSCSRDTDCCDNFCEMTSATGGYCMNTAP